MSPLGERRAQRRQLHQLLRHTDPFDRRMRRVSEHALDILAERSEPELLVHPLSLRDHEPLRFFGIEPRTPPCQRPQRLVRHSPRHDIRHVIHSSTSFVTTLLTRTFSASPFALHDAKRTSNLFEVMSRRRTPQIERQRVWRSINSLHANAPIRARYSSSTTTARKASLLSFLLFERRSRPTAARAASARATISRRRLRLGRFAASVRRNGGG
jgi:hypothetical protein